MESIELAAAVLFGIALVHTFSARQLDRLARRYPNHEGLFHLLGEVEVVFGFWAMVLMLALAALSSWPLALAYVDERNYTEPLFVFAIMVVAASHPVLDLVRRAGGGLARMLRVAPPAATVWLGLGLLPLLGSLVTEPAAMTIAALLLAPQVFRAGVPEPLKYFAL